MNEVTKPMVTVPKIAMGISVAGVLVSSAKWVAESKQEKLQLGLIKPTINAIPAVDQPVAFSNLTNTKSAFW